MLLYSKQMITENVFIEISACIYLSNEHFVVSWSFLNHSYIPTIKKKKKFKFSLC